jgi:4-amino-4-deoxy-L-arabinose transferase-like glycosyltransferase
VNTIRLERKPSPKQLGISADRARASRVLRGAMVIAAVLAIVAYLILAIRRAGYPFQLEWLEGGAVEHVHRILGGQPLYTAPSVDFVAYPYPPMYFWLAAAVARLTGEGFLPLRLVSGVATLASMVLLCLIVRREDSGWLGGLVAAGLFAAAFRLTGGFYDLARVDALFVALTLASALVAVRARRPASFAVAGAILCLAALTKQSALIAGAPLAAWLLVRRDGRRRDGVAFIAGALIPLAVVSLLLNARSSGWYGVTVADVLAGHGVDPHFWRWFWTQDLFPYLAPSAILAVLGWMRRPSGRAGMYYSIAGGLAAAAYISRLHSASGPNVLIPVAAAAAMLAGLAVARRPVTSVRLEIAVLLLCGTQFILLAYNPWAQVPPRSQTAAARRLAAVLPTLPGEVMLVAHPWETTLAGKGEHAHTAAIADVVRTSDHRPRLAIERSIAAAVQLERFSVLAFDDPSDYAGFPTDLDRWYRRVPAPPGLEPPGVSSLLTPLVGHPTEWWVARRLDASG